jgi:hypothetical protein
MRNSKLKSVAALFAALAVIVSLGTSDALARGGGGGDGHFGGGFRMVGGGFHPGGFHGAGGFHPGGASPTAMAMAGADMVGAATRGDIPTGATHIWVRSACSACNDLGPGRGWASSRGLTSPPSMQRTAALIAL